MRIGTLTTSQVNSKSTTNPSMGSKALAGALITGALLTSTPKTDVFEKQGIPPLSPNNTTLDSITKSPKTDSIQLDMSEISVFKNVSSYIKKENVVFQKDYKFDDGQTYTLYFLNNSEDEEEKKNRKLVTDIYIVPEDYKGIRKDGEENDLNSPPRVTRLFLHIPKDKNQRFVGAYIEETLCNKKGEVIGTYRREMKLPDSMGQKISNLFSNSEYRKFSFYVLSKNVKDINTRVSLSRDDKLLPEVKIK